MFRSTGFSFALTASLMLGALSARADGLPANKEIMKISSTGAVPDRLALTAKDGSVFFVNTTRDDLLTLSVDFGPRRPHCSSSNMKYGKDGVMRTVTPIVPKDFAILCFPESGSYEVTIAGLDGGRSTKKATVIAP